MAANQEYLLGMDPAEIRRLEQQHETWRHQTERVWKLAGFRAGQTIVDLGSGPGFTSLDLVGVVGASGRVVAVDSSTVASGYSAGRSQAERDSKSRTGHVRMCLASISPRGILMECSPAGCSAFYPTRKHWCGRSPQL